MLPNERKIRAPLNMPLPGESAQRDAGAEVSALEREIDELVYALYDLKPEEIKIVEKAAR